MKEGFNQPGYIREVRATLLLLLGVACWLLHAGKVIGASTIELGTASGKPGSVVRIPVRLHGDSPVVAGQFEITTDSPYILVDPPEIGAGNTSHRLLSSSTSAASRKLVIYSVSNVALRDGVVAWLPVRLLANSPDVRAALSITNVSLTTRTATAVSPVFSLAGAVDISGVGFERILRQPEGPVEIELFGREDHTYVVQAASSPSEAWSNISTNTITNGVIRVVDSSAGSGTRFYRLLSIP
ncbi:MAG: hypothetical protein RI897_1058 [Verrucomicrobiota bacterium]